MNAYKRIIMPILVTLIILLVSVNYDSLTEQAVSTEQEITNIAYCDISGVTDKDYTGKKLTQNVTVYDKEVLLRPNVDYAVTYKNNKRIGIATVTVQGLGQYIGAVTKEFSILPAKITSLSIQVPRNKQIRIYFNRYKNVNGYQIQYSKDNTFETYKSVDTDININTLKHLQKNSTYYIRVRAYKDASQRMYGSWSKVESIKAKEQKNRKVCYLTFDDGPSKNTLRILKVLKKQKVKATFFVTAQAGERKEILKKVNNHNHSIGIHSYSHDYSKIYKSSDAYFKDLNKMKKVIYHSTGVSPEIVRFPGGTNNTVSKQYRKGIMTRLSKKLTKKGYVYYDWNCDSTDASKKNVSAKSIVSAVTKQAKNKNKLVVLMHDSAAKDSTVKALPKIIRKLKKEGFVFEPLTPVVEPVQFKPAN